MLVKNILKKKGIVYICIFKIIVQIFLPLYYINTKEDKLILAPILVVGSLFLDNYNIIYFFKVKYETIYLYLRIHYFIIFYFCLL